MSRDAVIELATSSGVDPEDLLEYWGERAAIREIDGGQSRDEAERDALEDLRELLALGHWMLRKGPRSIRDDRRSDDGRETG